MKLPHVLKTIPLAALAATCLMPAAGASGSASQLTILQDDAQIVFTSPSHRAGTLDELKKLGVDVVKIRVDWRSLAPSSESKKKPSGFDGSDPAAYPAANWAVYDEAISAVVDRGMRPHLLLGGRAPDWASHGDGIVRPSAKEFGRFAHAVGTRYSGTYTRTQFPLAPALPRVDIWALWNEPNLYSWLKPQYSHGRPVAPRLYRQLVRAGNSGLRSSGHGGDEILIGDLLPFARSGEAGHSKTRPIEFLRELACVDKHYHPFKGKAAKARGCSKYKPLPGTGLAYHPYTLPGGPDVANPNPDDASIAELSRVLRALDRLSHAHRLKATRMPIWITEFGFQTDPPDRYQSPIKKVPGFLGQSEWLAYRSPRVESFAQYPLVDDAMSKTGGGFQSGLRKHNGKKKPGVYEAWRRPLFVQRRSDKVVEVFGGIRAGTSGQKVTIESRVGHKGGFKPLSGGSVQLGSQGYFDRVFSLSKATKRQYRFRFSGGKSRTATVHG